MTKKIVFGAALFSKVTTSIFRKVGGGTCPPAPSLPGSYGTENTVTLLKERSDNNLLTETIIELLIDY